MVPNKAKVTIKWAGDAPGLSEHRLSVAAFRKPLSLLLDAFRRIASGVLTNALGPTYGKKGGRYAKAAEALDLAIVKVGEGSLEVELECTLDPVPGTNFELFQDLDLPTVAARTFLEDLRAESQTELRNVAVRKFLTALPPGIQMQKYEAHSDGVLLGSVEFKTANVPETPRQVPSFIDLKGDVLGVGFDSVRPEVRIRTDEGNYHCIATLAQVERAIELRHGRVWALAASSGNTHRLLWIRAESAEMRPISDEEREAMLFTKWDPLLRKLAQ